MKIVDSDAFLDLPLTTQCLYFHLNMRADDDGFIGNPKRVAKLIGCNDDDLKLLIAKRFVIAFEDGVIVIKHWRMHNSIQKDRYTPTAYQDELKQLGIKDNNSYTLSNVETKCIQNVSKMETKCIQNVSVDIDIDKDIVIDKDIDNNTHAKKPKHKYGEYSNVLLTDDEFNKLNKDYSNANELITFLDEYIEMKGYKAKSHYLAIKKWVVDAVNERKKKAYKEMPNEVTSNPFIQALMEQKQ